MAIPNFTIGAPGQQPLHLTDIASVCGNKQKNILRILEELRNLGMPNLLCPI